MTINHQTTISLALAGTIVAAAVSFGVMMGKFNSMVDIQTEQGKKIDKTQQDVAYIRGKLELRISEAKP